MLFKHFCQTKYLDYDLNKLRSKDFVGNLQQYNAVLQFYMKAELCWRKQHKDPMPDQSWCRVISPSNFKGEFQLAVEETVAKLW